jgi:outer membrane protein assembly factor BamB
MCILNRLIPAVASCLVVVVFVCQGSAFGEDWPQFRGPGRNGISQETGLLAEWPKEGPKLLWQVKDIGSGYSTPAAVGERLYLLGNEGLDNEFVQAISIADGKRIWSTHLGKVGKPDQNPNYPAARSTPTVDGALLYALGSDGDLVCAETARGTIRWQKNLRTEFNGKPGTWAYAESPLIDGDALLCTPGGSYATIVALDKKTGDLLWKCAVPGGDEAAYASMVIVDAGGAKQYVQLLQKGLVGVEAKTGKFLWRYAKTVSPFNANIPTPTARTPFIYASSAGAGGGLVKLRARDGAFQADEVYFSSKLPTAIGGTVLVGDYLYGTAGPKLACIKFTTGDVKWSDPAIGAASLCVADGRLYLHGESGDVALVEISPDGYHEKGRFTPPDQPAHVNKSQKAWAYPVVANGKLYIRDLGTLWCYDVKAGKK